MIEATCGGGWPLSGEAGCGILVDMPSTPDRVERRSADRILAFTDAVVAIALTLLVLPVVDRLVELLPDHHDVARLLFVDLLGQLIAFAISFAVIARLWFAQHELFRRVDSLPAPLVGLQFVWMFTIVFLPLPSAAIADYTPSAGTIAVYIGTMLVSSVSLTVVAVVLHRTGGEAIVTREQIVGIAASGVGFALALVLGVMIHGVGFWGLLLLAVTPVFERPIVRRWNARHPND